MALGVMEPLTREDIRDKIMSAVEVLENMREGTDAYSLSLQTLYVLSMGKYNMSNEGLDTSVFQKRTLANQVLNEVATISFLCHNLGSKMNQLPDIVNPEKGHSLIE